MSLAVGPISQVSVFDTKASLSCAAASGGTSPYTYQWYRSTTTGFTPGGGNSVSGATGLTLSDSGLIPNTTYFYKVVVTDTGNSNATATSAQLAVTTAATQGQPNAFAQSAMVGMIDLRFPYNTVSVQIDSTQATPLYAGDPVKMVDSADGVPKVIGCAASSDEVLGFINYSPKDVNFQANQAAEISMAGNVMYMYATAAIARGVQVELDLANHGVKTATGSSGNDIVGWAYDKAAGMGSLIRVFIKTPSFLKA